MVLETLALLSGVKDLFLYNRTSYKFNKTLDQERLYHLQKMRVEQIKLYRDDIRDLFDLVVSKMNNYYLINTLALGFSLGFYYEGKVPSDIPSWLYWLWAMSLASAIVFLFLSVWFAVHASVVAQMFLTRLLTQWLRLPVPGPDQIDAGAPKLEEFEKSSVNESLRVPILAERLKRKKTGEEGPGESSPVDLDPATTADPLLQEGYDFYMGHFYLFARLQKHWMSLDAYCRVCMVVGCNQILNAVTYTGLAYFALLDSQWGTVAFVFVPIIFTCIHVQINLLLSKLESVLFLIVHSLAPLLASLAAVAQMVYTNDNQASEGAYVAQCLALGSYLCHFFSSLFLLHLGLELHDGLPTRFTTVNYIDVLGILAAKAKRASMLSLPSQLSRGRSAEVVEKEEPPVDQVVPPAASMRRADTLYQTMFTRKTGLVLEPTGSAESGRRNAFSSTAHSRVSLKSNSSIDGPLDTPVPHTPDVIGKMPFLAYRLVGVTILVLWVAGILFGILVITDAPDIGWSNVISPAESDIRSVSLSSSHSRRLLVVSTPVYLAPPDLMMQNVSVGCSSEGVVVADGWLKNRVHLLSPRGALQFERFESPVLGALAGASTCQVYSEQIGEREFRVANTPLVRIPLSEEVGGLSNNLKFCQHDDSILGFSSEGISGRVLAWSAVSGKFLHAFDLVCESRNESTFIAGACLRESNLVVVYEKGDSCLV